MIAPIVRYFDDLLTKTILAGWLLLLVGVVFFSCGLYGVSWRINNIPDVPLEPTKAMVEAKLNFEKAGYGPERYNKIEESLKNDFLVNQKNYEPQLKNCEQYFVYYVSGIVWVTFLFLGIAIIIMSFVFLRSPN